MKKIKMMFATAMMLSTTATWAQLYTSSGGGAAVLATSPVSSNVGIGTNNPTAALNVATTGVLPFFVQRTSGQVNGLKMFFTSNPAASFAIGAGSTIFQNTSTGSDMFFMPTPTSYNLIMKPNGNNGIGTLTPAHKLHVNDGAIMISGATPGYGGPQLIFSDNNAAAPNGRWAIEYLTADANKPSMGGMNFWKPFPDAGGAGNYSLFLKDDGRIGMGVTDDNSDSRYCVNAFPAGYRLYVNGGILTTKVKVANYCSASWADYVFAADYKLKPLSEVETFIQQNSHLPNVPSAMQLEEEGLDLAEMAAIQMEKIEELTLYLIEMKKEIEILKADNAALKNSVNK